VIVLALAGPTGPASPGRRVKIALGVLPVLVAGCQFRGRPDDNEQPQMLKMDGRDRS
jgi:hypothetical protein